jgi:hypothetical protein
MLQARPETPNQDFADLVASRQRDSTSLKPLWASIEKGLIRSFGAVGRRWACAREHMA